MKLAHICIVARDADKLAAFYKKVFECRLLREPIVLSGGKVSRGNGLPNSRIYSIWLTLADRKEPFLEIHQHKTTCEKSAPRVNEPGFSHLAFEVDDIRKTYALVIRTGGTALGEITDFGSAEAPLLIVYMRDPEGNILELEQS
ncbi:VOC family protein [uncultured Roseovarius sp.]|uniref:VOC family protein n=1 Tax=uncultured Roseovarius sp. TaxID=293344 RepID=UPI0026350A26|nr:VOC family protein [uncultured Roseovarius sp.]